VGDPHRQVVEAKNHQCKNLRSQGSLHDRSSSDEKTRITADRRNSRKYELARVAGAGLCVAVPPSARTHGRALATATHGSRATAFAGSDPSGRASLAIRRTARRASPRGRSAASAPKASTRYTVVVQRAYDVFGGSHAERLHRDAQASRAVGWPIEPTKVFARSSHWHRRQGEWGGHLMAAWGERPIGYGAPICTMTVALPECEIRDISTLCSHSGCLTPLRPHRDCGAGRLDKEGGNGVE